MDRLENGLTLEQVNGEGEIILHKKLLALAEKLCAAWPRRADGAGRGHTPGLECRLRARGEVEKNILANDGGIAFEDTLLVRMPEQEFGSFVGCLDRPARVASPRHKPDPPAVRLRFGERRIFITLPADRVIRVFPFVLDILIGSRALTWQCQIVRQRIVAVICDRRLNELKLLAADVCSWQCQRWRNRFALECRRQSKSVREEGRVRGGRSQHRPRVGVENGRRLRRLRGVRRPLQLPGCFRRDDVGGDGRHARIRIELSWRQWRPAGGDNLKWPRRIRGDGAIGRRRLCSAGGRACGRRNSQAKGKRRLGCYGKTAFERAAKQAGAGPILKPEHERHPCGILSGRLQTDLDRSRARIARH